MKRDRVKAEINEEAISLTQIEIVACRVVLEVMKDGQRWEKQIIDTNVGRDE